MDSGYIIGEYRNDKLRFDDKGHFYLGGSDTGGKYFYEEDGGSFARHIISALGSGSLYYCMPIVAWNYIIDSNILKKLIMDFNETIRTEYISCTYHKMFADKLDEIGDGPWYLIYEDFS